MMSDRRSVFAVCPTRLFRDDRGSTSFSVMIAIALVIAIMALTAQLYWVQSSSTSIQTVADAGALAGASMISKVVIIVQVLDGILLTMNLVGLVMHFVVVVAGIVAIFVPISAPVFEQMRSIDDAYMNIRQKVAVSFIRAAEALDRIAPYLAVANSAAVVAENSDVASSGSNYVGIAIPVPFQGDLESDGVRETMTPATDEAYTLGEETQVNREAAREAKAAKEEMDEAMRRGFEVDEYRSVPFAGWSFEVGKEDFLRELGSAFKGVEDSVPDFNPVDYRDTASEMNSDLQSRVRSWNSDCGFDRFRSIQYLYRTETGERYHTKGCKYLNVDNSPTAQVASDTASVALGDCRSQGLLPCGDVADAPRDWRALAEWDGRLGHFRPLWNDEVYWHRRYEEAAKRYERAVEREKSELEGVDDAFEQAKAKLLGRRLSYEPCGCKGFVCVVTQTNLRKLPAFTFPALTSSAGVQTGPQVAIAAAKILPAKNASSISGVMDAMLDKVRTGSSPSSAGPLAFIRPLAKGTDMTFELWGAALDFYTNGIGGLKLFVGRLFSSGWIPGAEKIRGWAEGIIDKTLSALNIVPPELRQPQPVLVNTRFVLDDLPEGAPIVKAKDAYFRSGGATASGLKLVVREWVRDATVQVVDNHLSGLDIPVHVRFRILGESVDFEYVLKLPLPEQVLAMAHRLPAELDGTLGRLALP